MLKKKTCRHEHYKESSSFWIRYSECDSLECSRHVKHCYATTRDCLNCSYRQYINSSTDKVIVDNWDFAEQYRPKVTVAMQNVETTPTYV